MNKIKKNKIWIILGLIVALGFFLRAYNFSEWLRFNADQARDYKVAADSVEKEELPLLGPKAGGTEFRLGPAFYYFQIASVGLFGNFPAAAAYPDLFFGTASIVLFFFFCRIYFKENIALGLLFLFAIAYFSVQYSRFAWNPNSTPFWMLLLIFALVRFSRVPENKKKLWAILAGLSLGIGVQLHTSLLIILPFFMLIAFFYLFRESLISKKIAAIILSVAIIVNAGQIVSEFATGGANVLQFFQGGTKKSERNSSWSHNVLRDISCHAKANQHIVSTLGDREECGYDDVLDGFKKLDSARVSLFGKTKFVFLFLLSLIFSLGGYFLLFRGVIKEKDVSKKLFLKLLGMYVALFFFFSIIWATELSIRFFLPLAFIPFILLGLWIEFLEKHIKIRWLPLFFIISIVAILNVQKINEVYRDLKYGGREIEGDFEYMTLGEGKFVVDFIRENSNEDTVYIDAQKGYLFKTIKPLNFLAGEKGINVVQMEKEIPLERGDEIFYIRNSNSRCELPESLVQEYKKLNCSSYRQFSVFKLERTK